MLLLFLKIIKITSVGNINLTLFNSEILLKKLRNTYYYLLSILSLPFKWFYRNKIRVLAYHDVPDGELFRDQILYLKSHYNIIKVQEFHDYLNGKIKLPQHSLLLTFDDGDISFLKNGFPVLKNLNVPACLFIITSLINTTKGFWWETVSDYYGKKGLNSLKRRKKINFLKTLPNKQRLEFLQNLEPASKNQLTSEDILMLQDNNISIGNHSHSHPMFDNCTKVEIINELNCSRNCFNKWNLEDYIFFAYPNGNVDLQAEEILELEGIKIAFLFNHKINNSKINPLRVSRIRSNTDMSLQELKVKVSGMHSVLQRVKF